MEFINKKSFVFRLRDHIQNRVDEFGAQTMSFGIFGVINYPLYYLVWKFLSLQSYENLGLRVIAALLCLGLVLKKYWPKQLKPWLAAYWYLTLLFCLPFFFTFMLLKNQLSNVWLMSTTLVVIWLMLLVDWLSFIGLLVLGVLFGAIAYEVTTPDSNIIQNFDYLGLAAQYFGAIAVILIFARNKEQEHKIKLKTLKAISASIAHELRTPLRTISCSLRSIEMNPEDKEKAIQRAESEIKASFNIIDMLLTKSNLGYVQERSAEKCSIKEVIEDALYRYPFKPGEEDKIHVDASSNFYFSGNKLLLTHVLFNLLKNALYHIRTKKQAQIFISMERKKSKGTLILKDTGVGIPEKALPYIFDQFFTQTQHGTGIGLYFSKLVVESFEGKIICHSQEGKYTEFQIKLPRIKK